MTNRLRVWLALATGLAMAAFTLVTLPPADTWWHLAAGRYILEHGLPATDPFSFTAGDHPWVNHEWLVTVWFELLYRAGGLTLLYAMRSLVVVVAFVGLPLVWAWRRQSEPLGWPMLVVLAWACQTMFFIDLRAYLVSYLLLSLTFLCILFYRESEKIAWLLGPVLALPLWANCHGAFVLGAAALGSAALGCWLEGRRPQAGWLAGGALLGYLLTALNPYGTSIWMFPFSLLGRDAFRLGLNEWAAPDLSGAQLAYLLLTLVAAVLVLWRGREDRVLCLWALLFLAAGLKTWRHEPLAGLALAYILPGLVPEIRWPSRWIVGPLLSLAAGLLLWQRASGGVERLTGLHTFFPVHACDWIEANPGLPGRILNPYEWGGYLLWRLGPQRKIFFDGRAHTVYPEQVYIDGLFTQFGEPWSRLLEREGFAPPSGDLGALLDRYQVEMVLVNRLQGNLATRLPPGWYLAYEDSNCLAFLRNTPENRSRTLLVPPR